MKNHDLEQNQKHPKKEMPRYTEIAINSLALSQEGKAAFCKVWFFFGGGDENREGVVWGFRDGISLSLKLTL